MKFKTPRKEDDQGFNGAVLVPVCSFRSTCGNPDILSAAPEKKKNRVLLALAPGTCSATENESGLRKGVAENPCAGQSLVTFSQPSVVFILRIPQ